MIFLFFVFFIATNVFRSAAMLERMAPSFVRRLAYAAAASGVVVALAAVSSQLLDALGLSIGSYQLGAGVVVALVGAVDVIRGVPAEKVDAAPPADSAWADLFAVYPTLLTPGVLAYAVVAGSVSGVAISGGAYALVALIGSLSMPASRAAATMFGPATRLVGAIAIIAGCGIAFDALFSI